MSNKARQFARGVVAVAFVVGGPGAAWVASAAPFAAKATANATVRPAGPRSGTSGTNFFNVQGSANTTNASFGTLDYSASSFGFNGGVTDVGSTLTLALVESNASFTRPGNLNFYLTRDTSTMVMPGATTPIFDSTSLPDGVGGQFSPRNLIGTGTFNTTGDTASSGTVDTYTLTLGADDRSYLLGQLNAGGTFRLLVTPGNDAVSATWAGNTNTTYATSTTLTLDATLDTPTLAWVGGTGTWDNANTNWRRGATPTAWDPASAAVFAAAPAGTVTLGEPITATKGLRFDVDGYTVAGAAANNLTLGGSAAVDNTVAVTGAADAATISARVSGSNGLTKSGAGRLVLAGANDFAGGVRVTGGVLAVGADANLGAAANGVALSAGAAGGTLRATQSFAVAGGRGPLTGSGTVDAATAATVTFNNPVDAANLIIGSPGNAGTVVFAGPTTLAGAAVAAGTTLRVSGPLTIGAAPVRVNFSGDGTVELTGNNSLFAGGIQLSRGAGTVGPTVDVNSAAALGSQGTIFFNAGTLRASAPLTGASAINEILSFGGAAGTLAGANMELTAELQLFGSVAKTLTVSNDVTLSGGVGPQSATSNSTLAKAGTGTLTIASAPDAVRYVNTRVLDGLLRVTAASELGAGDVTVSSAAAGGDVVLETANAVSFDDATNVALLTAGGRAARLFLNFSAAAGSDTVNSLTLNGAAVAPGVYGAGNLPGFITGTGTLRVTAIPEPSGVVAAAVAAAGLLSRRRRPRRVAAH